MLPTRATLTAVFVGGALGALVRTGLAEAWPAGALPWATLLANVLGCALLALVTARTDAGGLARAGLGPGLCGGLTTFSTLQVELVMLADAGHPGRAALYGALSAALSVGAYAVVRREVA